MGYNMVQYFHFRMYLTTILILGYHRPYMAICILMCYGMIMYWNIPTIHMAQKIVLHRTSIDPEIPIDHTLGYFGYNYED